MILLKIKTATTPMFAAFNDWANTNKTVSMTASVAWGVQGRWSKLNSLFGLIIPQKKNLTDGQMDRLTDRVTYRVLKI